MFFISCFCILIVIDTDQQDIFFAKSGAVADVVMMSENE